MRRIAKFEHKRTLRWFLVPAKPVMLRAAHTAMPFLLKAIYFRYSLRLLLAATTVLGALLGLVGNEFHKIRLHRQAERKVHALGGRCGFVTGDRLVEGWGPAWFPVVRNSYYADYQGVWFNSTSNAGLQDQDLAVLKHFPRLKILEIAAPLITDEGMAHVQRIKSLRELQLYETKVTSRGLWHLRGIPMKRLVLAGRGVSDETLGALEEFPALQRLMITETSVTNAGMEHLKHVPLLEKLFLADSPIGDSAMSRVAKLMHLREVTFIELPITDDGISRLAGLERLEYLEVVQTQVTDKGLLAFRETPTLKYLGVGPRPTSDTLKSLTSALHGCQVFDSGGIRCLQGW
jgi:hypothetical protein